MKKVVISLFFLFCVAAFFASPSFAFHGGFSENTSTCARCHSTHKSEAKSLLIADGITQTCKVCHDGTTGYKMVFGPADQEVFNLNTPDATGYIDKAVGTFGGASTSMSSHLSQSAVTLGAAPGGTTSETAPGEWTQEFTCSSCHNAHGSYSSKAGKYLNNNPNGMASVAVAQGGRKLVSVPVVTTLDNNSAAEFVYHNADGKLVLKRKVKISNKGVYTTYWVEDKSPWLKSVVKNNAGVAVTDITVNANINSPTTTHVPGMVPNITGAGIGNVVSVDVERAYYVESPANKADYWVSLKDGAPNMAGIQISEFCASCHTDYLTHSGGSTSKHTGEEYFGHTTDSASYTCVRCHFAHGTDVNLMVNANGNGVFDLLADPLAGYTIDTAQAHLKDENSSLKKFVGSSFCWACHNASKSADLVHDGKASPTRPKGMPAGF